MQRDKVCMSDLDNGLQEYLNHLRMDYAQSGWYKVNK